MKDATRDTQRRGEVFWFGRTDGALRHARSALRANSVDVRVVQDAAAPADATEPTIVVVADELPGWRQLPSRWRRSHGSGGHVVVLLSDEAALEGRVPGADTHLLLASSDWPERLAQLLSQTGPAASQGAPVAAVDAQASPAAVNLGELRAAFAELGAADSEVEALVRTYLEELPAAFARLDRAVESADATEVAAAAHALKSPSATLGATAFAELLRRLEEMGRSGSLPHARHLLELARLEAERVRDALLRELPGGEA